MSVVDRRRRWVVSVKGETVQVLTLYGDPDENTRAALLTMIQEAIGIASAAGLPGGEVSVRCYVGVGS